MKKRKPWNRLLSLTLCLCMVLSMAPISPLTAFAVGTDTTEAPTEFAPVCYCAEACTAEVFNEYCQVCGVDYTACTGTDTAVQYAEGTPLSIGDNAIVQDITYTYTAEKDGTLYVTVTELYDNEGYYYNSYEMNYGYCAIEINGTAINTITNTVEVKKGDEITVALQSLKNYTFYGTIKLSYEPFVSAEITGVTLTVDGVTYTGAEGEGYAFINPNSDIIVNITGVNLNNLIADNVISGFLLWIDGTADWVINEDGTEASLDSPASDWEKEHWILCSNGNLTYTNNVADWQLVDTGILPIYLDNAGTDLTTIYFNNTKAWETITATFYTVGDSQDYKDNYQLGTAELSLVGGESVIYSTSSIPNNAAYVTFSNGTETTDMVAIPMASTQNNCYNNGTWEHFHTPEADDGDCLTEQKCVLCGETAVEAKESHSTTEESNKATCQKQAKCDLCGTEYGEKDASNHVGTLGTHVPTEDGKHTAIRSCCGTTVTEDHIPDNEIGQTCMGYFCTVCESWYGEGNDVHITEKDENKATCLHGDICDRCAAEYTQADYYNHVGSSAANFQWPDSPGDYMEVYVGLMCDICGGEADYFYAYGDAITVETIPGTDCKNPGTATYTLTYEYNGVTYSDSKSYTIPSDNHAAIDGNGFCSDCGGYEAAVWNEEDWVYEIYNAGQLYWYAQQLNEKNAEIYVKLTADIVIPENAPNWVPINASYAYFDGNFKTISGLKCVSDENFVGLFGNEGWWYEIKNLHITDSYFEGSNYVGALVAALGNGGSVTNCYVTNTTVKGDGTVGTLVGYLGMSHIVNCFVDTETLVGYNSSYGSIENSYYLSETDDGNGGKTAAQFASGEVACLLQSGQQPGWDYDEEGNEIETPAPRIWGQEIGQDAYPVLGGPQVYKVLDCDGVTEIYSNTDEQKPHSYGTDSFCTVCYEECVHTPDETGEYCAGCGNFIIAKGMHALLCQDGEATEPGYVDGFKSGGIRYYVDINLALIDGCSELYVYGDACFNGDWAIAAAANRLEPRIKWYLNGHTLTLEEGWHLKAYDLEIIDGTIIGSYDGPLLYCSADSGRMITRDIILNGVTLINQQGYAVSDGHISYGEYFTWNITLLGGSVLQGAVADVYYNSYEQGSLIFGDSYTGEPITFALAPEITAEGFVLATAVEGVTLDPTWLADNDPADQLGVFCDRDSNSLYLGICTHDSGFVNGFCACGNGYEEPEQIDGVYQIGNAGQLYWFAALVNGGETSADAVLTDHITVNENVLADGVLNGSGSYFRMWTPIGQNGYTGTFDGQGFTISGLYMNRETGVSAALFSRTSGTIQNLGIEDSFFYAEYGVAAIAGENNGTITNCSNSGYVCGNWSVAGIAGFNYGTVDKCWNSGRIVGDWKGTTDPDNTQIGGIVGYSAINTYITDCYNTGDISGTKDVAGIVGTFFVISAKRNSGRISGCYNTGNVVGDENVGGIAGRACGNFLDCYNTGAVSGEGNIGGIIGAIYTDYNGVGYDVTNCYNTGTVTGTGNNTGGITGQGGIISGCYNTGKITGDGRVGGITGTGEDHISNSYNTGAVTGSTYVGGVAGHTQGKISNSYNTGAVSGSDNVGGVVGYSHASAVTNSYNTGTVSGSDNVGGVVGYSYVGTVSNCYYLTGTAIDGFNGADATGFAEHKADFSTGEVAYLLGEAFGQTIGTDAFPVLGGATVYPVLNCKDEIGGYSNTEGQNLDHSFADGSCTVCGEADPDYVAPTKVEGLACTEVTEDSFTLSWEALAGKNVKYWVYVNDKIYASTTGTTLTVAGRKPGMTYNVSVTAKLTNGTILTLADADIISVLIENYSVSGTLNADAYSVNIDWAAENCTKAWLYYGTDVDDLKLYSASADGKFYKGNLTPNTTYYFQIAYLIGEVKDGDGMTTTYGEIVFGEVFEMVTQHDGALDVSRDGNQLTWGAVEDSNKYWIVVSIDGKEYVYATTETAFTLTRFTPEQLSNATITVRGKNSSGVYNYNPVA